MQFYKCTVLYNNFEVQIWKLDKNYFYFPLFRNNCTYNNKKGEKMAA